MCVLFNVRIRCSFAIKLEFEITLCYKSEEGTLRETLFIIKLHFSFGFKSRKYPSLTFDYLYL